MAFYHVIEIGVDHELVITENLNKESAIIYINSHATNNDIKFNKVKVFKSETIIEEISIEMKTLFQLKGDSD